VSLLSSLDPRDYSACLAYLHHMIMASLATELLKAAAFSISCKCKYKFAMAAKLQIDLQDNYQKNYIYLL
jgi:hypothetical protein